MKSIEAMADFFRSLALEDILILIFMVALATEWLTGKLRQKPVYRLRDSISNFTVGAVSFLADLLFSVITFPLWIWLYDHARLFDIDSTSAWMLVLLFVLIDFTEYWFHRFSHETNVLWSAHQVHHQSECFNLTVGLRTSLFIPLFNLLFYLAFPVLGFDPLHMVLIILLQGVYQLLIHTQLIGRLGWMEYVIVTPSMHRVHHGKNDIYLDRNYGKCLVIWDLLFGTYARETETVLYGVTCPPQNSNVFHVLFHPYRQLALQLRKAGSMRNRILVLFRGPGRATSDYSSNDPSVKI